MEQSGTGNEMGKTGTGLRHGRTGMDEETRMRQSTAEWDINRENGTKTAKSETGTRKSKTTIRRVGNWDRDGADLYWRN